MLVCKFCSKECRSVKSHRSHELTCPSNKDRVYKNGMTGKKAWNKGKTVDTHPELADKLCAGGLAFKHKCEEGFMPYVATSDYWTEERREEKSKWRIKLHIDDPSSHPNRRLANNRSIITYPEKVAFDFLVKNGVEFEHQKKIDKYYVDFCIGNVIIEIDGEQWHPLGNERDAKRDKALGEMGYVVFRVRSKERIEDRLADILGSI